MVQILLAHPERSVRKRIMGVLNLEKDMNVASIVRDPEMIFEKVEVLEPDVLMLGLFFDNLSGLDVIDQIMKRSPVPILVVEGSGEEVERRDIVKAFSYGAIDFISEDNADEEVLALVRMAAQSEMKDLVVEYEAERPEPPEFSDKIVVIGGSTGGPPSLEFILRNLSPDIPAPVVAVQHMAPRFTSLFAERLDSLCDMEVVEAGERQPLRKGVAWMAPGNRNVLLERDNGDFYIDTRSLESGQHIPSIDTTLRSASNIYGSNTIAVILTGMGRDGVMGARFVKSAGGSVIVQDEQSSLVYGIGKRVVRQGDADEVVSLGEIPEAIVERL